MAFSKGDECHWPSKSGPCLLALSKAVCFSSMAQGAGEKSAFFAPLWRGLRALCAGGFGERACAVRRWGWLRSGRTLQGAAGAGKRKVSGRPPLLRYALPAGAPDPRARCYHLQNIWGSTLGTVALEGVASRVRRAPIAAQGKPLCLMRLAHDAGRPARGAHAVRAVQLSHARLIQECAPRGRELLSPRGPRGSAGWTPPGTWSRALKTGGKPQGYPKFTINSDLQFTANHAPCVLLVY